MQLLAGIGSSCTIRASESITSSVAGASNRCPKGGIVKLLHTIHVRRPIRTALAVLAVAAVPVGAVAVPATADGDRHHGTIELVSIGASGGGGDAGSFQGTEKGLGVSADGRYVVFSSYATDLVADDTNSQRDVFVRDTMTGRTKPRISRGRRGSGQPGEPARVDLGRRAVRRLQLLRLQPAAR